MELSIREDFFLKTLEESGTFLLEFWTATTVLDLTIILSL